MQEGHFWLSGDLEDLLRLDRTVDTFGGHLLDTVPAAPRNYFDDRVSECARTNKPLTVESSLN